MAERPPANPLLRNTSIVKPDDLEDWQDAAWDAWYVGSGCVVCGGYFCHRGEARNLLYPALVDRDDTKRIYCPTLPPGSWVTQCDCPAPRNSSACEVSPW